MSEGKERLAATTGDVSRPVATSEDSPYSLSIEDVLARYDAAGIPRTRRSVQRYCANGALDAHRVETPFGEKFLITPESVDRHIAYINEVRPVATSHDLPRPVATDVEDENRGDEGHPGPTTGGDQPRQAPTDGRYVAALERENEFLRGQITVKDSQIGELQERAHETNALINGLQRLLAPLLTAPDHARDGERP